MAHVKNIGGGPGDEDPRPPPCLSTKVKGKAKKLMTKNHKFVDAEIDRAAVVVAAIERAERGGSRGGIHIAYQLSPAQRAIVERSEILHGSPPRTVMLGGRCVALEESQPQGEIEQQT